MRSLYQIFSNEEWVSNAREAAYGKMLALVRCLADLSCVCEEWHRTTNRILVSQGERPFVCQICQARFNSRGNLNAHHLDHHAVRIDSASFHCFQTLLRWFIEMDPDHLSFSTDLQEKKFRCEVCGKLFGRKYRLRCHLQRHSVGFTQL